MNRESIGPVALAVICIVAVVFAAATLSSPRSTGGGDLATGANDGGGIGDDSTGDGLDLWGDDAQSSGFIEMRSGEFVLKTGSVCVPFLQRPEVVAGIVGAFVLFAYLVKRRIDEVAAVGLTLTFAFPVGVVYLLLTSCGDGEFSAGLPEEIIGGGAGREGTVGVSDNPMAVDPTQVPPVIYLALALVLVVVLAYALSDRGGFAAALEPIWSRREDAGGEAAQANGGAAATLGRVAGRAADRIEEGGTDVENEVYRAWREMTRPLDVERPESSTPAEFATAATDAGVSRDDVDELTELFEQVRYGGYDPDAERESRAVDALRRIETQYVDLEGGDES
jgi:hypothetical protein